MTIEELLTTYPRTRQPLPQEYQAIYDQHYSENRNGLTFASNVSGKMEHWLHKKVAKSSFKGNKTLEIGAGTLNQLYFETPYIYDIVEPYVQLYENVEEKKYIRNFYMDIMEIEEERYDRIISIATFEHILNLPEVIEKTILLLHSDGKLCVSIPNEGGCLWKCGYTATTGREFKRRFGLEYEVIMRYEHINNANEIEKLLRYYYKNVKQSLCGIGRNFSFYRYYECSLV